MKTSRFIKPSLIPGTCAIRCALAAALSTSCFVSSAGTVDAQANADIFGQWRVVKTLDSADIAAISDRQARALVGKRLQIDSGSLTFQGMTCNTPSYARKTTEPAKYLREIWHARSGKLGLPDPVTVIDAQCTDLFLKSKNRMVFNRDGFFFEAVKT